MKCEAEESGDRDEDYQDPFIAEGLSHLPSSSDSDNPQPTATARSTRRRGTLADAKKKRESLKRRWFRYQERGAQQHRENLMDSDSEGSL
jgi:hypothetical protein